jgi:hypothetical protein
MSTAFPATNMPDAGEHTGEGQVLGFSDGENFTTSAATRPRIGRDRDSDSGAALARVA